MKNDLTWVEFIRQRVPSIVTAYFNFNRKYWAMSKGKSYFHDDGYYYISALSENSNTHDPVTVHITCVNQLKTFSIGIFALFWSMEQRAIELHAYLHSSDLGLLKNFCRHLEQTYARMDKRKPRTFQNNRVPIEAILYKFENRSPPTKPYRYLYCIK